MSDPMKSRVLHALDQIRRYRRLPPVNDGQLLAWGQTLPDEDLLEVQNVGPTTVAWLRRQSTDRYQPPTHAEVVRYEKNLRLEELYQALGDAERAYRRTSDYGGDKTEPIYWMVRALVRYTLPVVIPLHDPRLGPR
jgi:hypothetical protein